ncbi:HK97 family phage prohead protease [Sulfitobacter albidus]|uniref:HK97 family phage prohead protease n=1 Tax=Sulfitobacter albidus TaxID=2829501 RepID=A0A975PN19_9RHOB|nr:HK97 family phage prohead protease [Sulfitobacter albidus]QUJ77402.1 HK97 family phage prohead protease [Sulfitobacter albidus]
MDMSGNDFGLAPETGEGLPGLERKFVKFDSAAPVADGVEISGYASFFGDVDQGNDVVLQGAYARSLAVLGAAKRGVKMLWQHDPAQPIGVWDVVREDARGLFVKGRILKSVAKGREAIALIEAGAIDGLSIGYRTVKASKNTKGQRLLQELELWEVSLVTFPMLPSARVGAKAEGFRAFGDVLRDMAEMFEAARADLNAPRVQPSKGECG